MSDPGVLHFGSFQFDLRAVELRRGGVPVPLRARPLALLQAFVRQPGELLTKDQLLEQVWPGLVVEENNLQVQVSVLRKALGSAAIATLPGRGYRFTLAVRTDDVASPPARAGTSGQRLFGRTADLARLRSLLQSARLVTLCGPGGVGKTRLARAATNEPQPDPSRSVQWVDLADLADAALLTWVVLERVDPTHHDTVDSLAEAKARLVERLGQGATLLVLDNAEHLLDAVAALVDSLLRELPALCVFVTSQAPLHLPFEHVFRLPPLDLPADSAGLADAAANPAVALFAERATAVDARFRLDAATLPDVVSICRRLDGLPLALELAAARVPSFGLGGVARLLDARFRLLHAGPRETLARHHALQAVYDWTYSLLDEVERRVFRRLAVLGSPRPLVELADLLHRPGESGLDEWTCYDALAALVDRSLLMLDDGDPPRYSMLESARAYAMARLQAAHEDDVLLHACRWHERNGDRAAEAVGAMQALRDYGTALELLRLLPGGAERDQHELRLALKLGPAVQSTLGPSHERCEALYRRSVELARRFGPGPESFQAMWGYWHFLSLSGRDREAAPYAREIVEMAPRLADDGFQLEALHAEMTSADLLGDAPTVVARAERIGTLYDRCRHHRLTFAFGGHDPGVCALGQGSVNHWLCGDVELALDRARRALDLAASLGHGYTRATAAFYAAITYAFAGETAALARTADALVRLSDEHGMAMLLTEGRFFKAYSDHELGDPQALGRMEAALEAIEGSGDLGFVFVYMAMLGAVLLDHGRPHDVVSLANRALQHAVLGQGLFLPELFRLRSLARRMLGDSDWSRDAEEARRMALQQGAAALARRATDAIALAATGAE